LHLIGQVNTSALAWLPNCAGAVIVLALIGGLGWYALRQVEERAREGSGSEGTELAEKTATPLVQTQEELVEHQDKTRTAGEEERSPASKEERPISKEGSLFS